MDKYLRQMIFLVYTFLLRWPIWFLIWFFGRSGIFKTLFLIYPTDSSECLDFCPDIKWLRNFFSGRPTFAGLIMDGWRPMGIYFVIPNSALELMRRQNRPLVETIINRMLWIQKLSGAKAIGLAGQLGPIFEKRHGFSMIPPFYSSTFGNIFSIQKAVSHLVRTSQKHSSKITITIIGGGLLGELLEKYLLEDGYQISMIEARSTRKGDISLIHEKKDLHILGSVDLVINLLPRGKDFMHCRLHGLIHEAATIIDYSRPPLPAENLTQKVVMGNRVQRSGIHFFMRLPGGWKRHELPACSMPSLLASLGDLPLQTMEEFRIAASQLQFITALADVPVRQHKTIFSSLRNFSALHPIAARCILFIMKSRQAFSR